MSDIRLNGGPKIKRYSNRKKSMSLIRLPRGVQSFFAATIKSDCQRG
jgi:hypothetical protein